MTWARLLVRHLGLAAGRWAVVGAAVAAAAALTMLWPRWLVATTTSELREDLSGASASIVDPSASPSLVFPDSGSWASILDDLAMIRDGVPAPLSGVLGTPDAWGEWAPTRVPLGQARDIAVAMVQPASAPSLAEHATLTQGRLPAATRPEAPDGVARVEIALSEQSAHLLAWQVGEARQSASLDADLRPVELVLVGTFRADDESSRYWQHAPELLRPTMSGNNDTGPVATARGVIDPRAALSAVTAAKITATVHLWFPLDGARVDAQHAPTLVDQLRSTVSTVTFLGRPLTLGTDAGDRIEQVLARAASARGVLALVVGAPAGVLLAMLGLGARVAVAERRAAQLLVALRGGSLAQHRTLLAVEAALVCLPAAAVGGWAATALVPVHVTPWWWLAPAALGLAPVVGLATGTPWPRDGAPARTAVEVATTVLALAATVRLATRGVSEADAGSGGPDALAVTTPLLLAVAASLVCARALPLLLRPLSARLRRRDALVAPLGATLAARRAAPVVATIAVLTGAAVTVLGVLTTSSIDAARDTAARETVGADVRVRGALDTATIAALRAVPGVERLATLSTLSPVRVSLGDTREVTTVIAVDADLTDIQALVPGHVSVPAPGDVAMAGPLPGTIGDRLLLGATEPVEVTVTDRPTAAPGLTGAAGWALVDRRTLGDLGARLPVSAAYLELAPGTDDAAVTAAVRAAAGPGADVTTADGRLDQLRSAPTAAAMSLGVLLVSGVGLAAGAAAVALSLAAGATARTRVVAVLRTLGLPPRAELRLVLWEAAPGTAVALVAGAGLGVGLASLVLATTDLRPFTGGAAAVGLAVSPPTLGVALAVLVVLAVGSIAVSASAAARRSAAVVLRAGEDRT